MVQFIFYEHCQLWTRASTAISQHHNNFSLGFWDITEPQHPDYHGSIGTATTSAQSINKDTIDHSQTHKPNHYNYCSQPQEHSLITRTTIPRPSCSNVS